MFDICYIYFCHIYVTGTADTGKTYIAFGRCGHIGPTIALEEIWKNAVSDIDDSILYEFPFKHCDEPPIWDDGRSEVADLDRNTVLWLICL